MYLTRTRKAGQVHRGDAEPAKQSRFIAGRRARKAEQVCFWDAEPAKRSRFISGTPSPRSGRQHKAWGASPRKPQKIRAQARETGDSAILPEAVARFTGLGLLYLANLGLAPQALCCRPLSRARRSMERGG